MSYCYLRSICIRLLPSANLITSLMGLSDPISVGRLISWHSISHLCNTNAHGLLQRILWMECGLLSWVSSFLCQLEGVSSSCPITFLLYLYLFFHSGW
jgi:hypothetical protein